MSPMGLEGSEMTMMDGFNLVCVIKANKYPEEKVVCFSHGEVRHDVGHLELVHQFYVLVGTNTYLRNGQWSFENSIYVGWTTMSRLSSLIEGDEEFVASSTSQTSTCLSLGKRKFVCIRLHQRGALLIAMVASNSIFRSDPNEGCLNRSSQKKC